MLTQDIGSVRAVIAGTTSGTPVAQSVVIPYLPATAWGFPGQRQWQQLIPS
jgi:hypothetical protein